jgi:hypothetical protein
MSMKNNIGKKIIVNSSVVFNYIPNVKEEGCIPLENRGSVGWNHCNN